MSFIHQSNAMNMNKVTLCALFNIIVYKFGSGEYMRS